MKKEISTFGIFQDPLLTIIALILLGTLWIIIPGGKSGSTDELSPSQVQENIERVKKEIKALEKRIEEAKAEIQQLSDESWVLDTHGDEAEELRRRTEQRIDQLKQEIIFFSKLIRLLLHLSFLIFR